MHSVKIHSHVGADGTLRLSLPVEVTNTDVEVIVVIQPCHPGTTSETPEARGWPPRFFEETYGSLRDDPLTREPEGDFETRDAPNLQRRGPRIP